MKRYLVTFYANTHYGARVLEAETIDDLQQAVAMLIAKTEYLHLDRPGYDDPYNMIYLRASRVDAFMTRELKENENAAS
jgi:hypothetical protein